jgi:hypothetical protein
MSNVDSWDKLQNNNHYICRIVSITVYVVAFKRQSMRDHSFGTFSISDSQLLEVACIGAVNTTWGNIIAR